MQTQLNNQEIFLLTRYTSPPYFLQLRDAWGAMVDHVERCLGEYMQRLPANYRSKPLPEQPDAVWGETVLPNFRDTYRRLCGAYIQLLNGDIGALGYAHGPMNDYKGQLEFWSDWMSAEDKATYERLLSKAMIFAGNIVATHNAQWMAGELSSKYDENAQGPLDLPGNLPHYRLNPSVRLSSDDPVLTPGIFVPDLLNSSPQFLSPANKNAPYAIVTVGAFPIMGENDAIVDEMDETEDKPCVWTLVEIDDTVSLMSPKSLIPQSSHRVHGGSSCPETGYYFTPAKANSRRRFNEGEKMPDFSTDYGACIWQWDSSQA